MSESAEAVSMLLLPNTIILSLQYLHSKDVKLERQGASLNSQTARLAVLAEPGGLCLHKNFRV